MKITVNSAGNREEVLQTVQVVNGFSNEHIEAVRLIVRHGGFVAMPIHDTPEEREGVHEADRALRRIGITATIHFTLRGPIVRFEAME